MGSSVGPASRRRSETGHRAELRTRASASYQSSRPPAARRPARTGATAAPGRASPEPATEQVLHGGVQAVNQARSWPGAPTEVMSQSRMARTERSSPNTTFSGRTSPHSRTGAGSSSGRWLRHQADGVDQGGHRRSRRSTSRGRRPSGRARPRRRGGGGWLRTGGHRGRGPGPALRSGPPGRAAPGRSSSSEVSQGSIRVTLAGDVAVDPTHHHEGTSDPHGGSGSNTGSATGTPAIGRGPLGPPSALQGRSRRRSPGRVVPSAGPARWSSGRPDAPSRSPGRRPCRSRTRRWGAPTRTGPPSSAPRRSASQAASPDRTRASSPGSPVGIGVSVIVSPSPVRAHRGECTVAPAPPPAPRVRGPADRSYRTQPAQRARRARRVLEWCPVVPGGAGRRDDGTTGGEPWVGVQGAGADRLTMRGDRRCRPVVR